MAWLCFDQVNNNFISQAGQMETHGLPNDMLPLLLNSVTVIITLPIIQKFLYPWLNNKGIPLDSINRMTIGFFLLTISVAYAAGIQSLIYHSGPCYDRPLECFVNGVKGIPNTPSITLQIPIFIIQALAEIFCVVAGTEYAYKKAPESMKSFVQAIFICNGAVGSLLGLALSPASRNPHLVILFASIAAAMFTTTVVFWLVFRKQDQYDRENAS
jgi:proton-dependent oligopeptide transporter, POT family